MCADGGQDGALSFQSPGSTGPPGKEEHGFPSILWLPQLNPSLECHRVGNPRPGWGGRSPADRAAPRLAPERTGACLPPPLLLPGPGLKEEARKHRVGPRSTG